MKIFGLIVAAGLSSRMDGFKPLVRYNNKTFIEHIINKLSSVCDSIVIVTGFNGYALEDSVKTMYQKDDILKKVDFVHNQNFQNGMFSSILTGLREILRSMNDQDYVMFHLVDQPHISESVYKILANRAHDGQLKVIIPSYNMKAGHPIVLSKDIIEDIAVAPDSNNLRDILKKWRNDTTYIEITDESVLQDVNTPGERKEYLE